MSKVPTSRPPFRADHVGSLLRPKALRDAFRKRAGNEIDDNQFAAVQDAAIRDVVKLQEDAGLGVVTDGEFRRASYWGRFVERCQGFTIKPALFKFRDDHGHEMDFTATYAEGKVARARALAVDEYEFVSRVTAKAAKITLPAPSTMHLYRYADFANPAVYANASAFFADLAKVFREEIAALANAGCRYVQLDEVAIALLCDPGIRAKLVADKRDPDELIGLYIDSINDAVAGAPADMAIGVHMCRGNFKGHYLSEGGYDKIAERFFNETKVTHFLLEYDTPRAGDFAPLRFVPKGKGVVLGLVSSKSAALEQRSDLECRIAEASKFIDLDRLGVGPQCGFASTVAGNPLTAGDQSAKLRLVVDTAKAVWGSA